VGSLIRGQAFRGPQGGKWRPAPFCFPHAPEFTMAPQLKRVIETGTAI